VNVPSLNASANLGAGLPGGGSIPVVPGASGGAFPLPAAGDLSAQVAQGSKIVAAMSSGDTTSLFSAGVSLAKAAGGNVGADIAGVVAAASAGGAIGAFAGSMSGLACCGPYGAIAAAVITAVVEIVSAFESSYQGVGLVFPREASSGAGDAPSVVIANDVANYPVPSATGNLNTYGDPPGWNLYDYLATKYPPHTTKRPWLALHLMQAVAREIVADQVRAVTAGDNSATAALDWISTQGNKNPLSGCGVIAGPVNQDVFSWANWIPGNIGLSGGPSVSPQTFMTPGWGWGGGCQALATPVLWHWLDWNNIRDVVNNLTFGAGGAGGTADQLLQKLSIAIKPLEAAPVTVTHAGKKVTIEPLTQHACLVRALQRAPDSLYFDADLHGCVYSTQGIGANSFTMYYNVDLKNMLATVLAMLQSGACTLAIVRELQVQCSILVEGNALGKGLGNPENVPAGCRALLDDYIALAHLENADPSATMAKVIAMYPKGFMGRVPEPHPSPVKAPKAPSPGGSSAPSTAATARAAVTIRSFLARYLSG
jgi:hypothetical protein